MRLLVAGANREMDRLLTTYPYIAKHLGVLVQPKSYSIRQELPFAADNLAYNGFDSYKYRRLITRIVHYKPLWITMPDKVGDAKKTLEMFYEWLSYVDMYKLPKAFVLQDGVDGVPWDHISAIFIGGSTPFKYSQDVRSICKEAKIRGKLIHAGRVNTQERIAYFHQLGADTFDGSGYSVYPRYISDAIITLASLEKNVK